MTPRPVRAALSALVLVAAACGSDPIVPPSPAAIVRVTAPSLTAPVGGAAGTFAVRVTDEGSSPIAGVTVTFTTVGSGTVSPATVTTDASGIAATTVTAGASPGPLTIAASVASGVLRVEATVVVVSDSGAPCVSPSTGQASSYQGISSACFRGGAAVSEYVLVAFNKAQERSASTTLSGVGLTTPPAASLLSPVTALALRGETGVARLTRDVAFHERLQERTQTLAPRFAGARRWQAAMRAARGGSPRSAESGGASFSKIPADPQVGQIVQVNINAKDNCASPIYRGARIMAVTSKAVVLADTTNPAGGFTTEDYQRFGLRFDTLVYPLDVANFGAPTDIDGNGRIGIVFTRGVNELTERNSGSFVGGFFYSRDLFPVVATPQLPACAGSNEGELFYMLAPDPTGIAYVGSDGTPSSSNIRRIGFVDSLTTGTIAHEFQHLINAARRIYVNDANAYETVWLNEGLSHIAEELLYYRESGRSPRQNLTDAIIRQESALSYSFWKQDMSQNFARFRSYLLDPGTYSPTQDDDALAIRGATWSFLRYAADQLYAADGDLWLKLANGRDSGFATLRLGLGNEPVALLRDWTVANYIDDSGFSAEPRYMHKSWNFRDIYTKTYQNSPPYPLKVNGLTSVSAPVTVAHNSAVYYRFAVAANTDARIQLGGNTPSGADFEFVVIRTK